MKYLIAVCLTIVGVMVMFNALTVPVASAIHQIYVTANFILAVMIFILAKLITK